MYEKTTTKQILFDFALPFRGNLNPDNRWVKKSTQILWEYVGFGEKMNFFTKPYLKIKIFFSCIEEYKNIMLDIAENLLKGD